jgi:hypothetical protein
MRQNVERMRASEAFVTRCLQHKFAQEDQKYAATQAARAARVKQHRQEAELMSMERQTITELLHTMTCTGKPDPELFAALPATPAPSLPTTPRPSSARAPRPHTATARLGGPPLTPQSPAQSAPASSRFPANKMIDRFGELVENRDVTRVA